MSNEIKSSAKFGEKVKETREKKGIKLETISQKTGLSYTYLSRLENGKANISIDNADLIAKALKVKLSRLVKE